MIEVIEKNKIEYPQGLAEPQSVKHNYKENK